MPEIAIVVPTVPGRENDLARCLLAYRKTSPRANIYVERDHQTCGEAWIAGAAKAARDGFDYLHLTADDIKPHAGWLKVAVETVTKGFIPAPLVRHPNGALQSAGIAGFGMNTASVEDWAPVEGTTVPFLTREMWDAVGMIPVHYCSDIWVSERGRAHGWQTVVRTGMVFTHYTAQPGRNEGRADGDMQEYLRYVREAA